MGPSSMDKQSMPRCPPELTSLLQVNNLSPDEQTARDGNCGVDAFARSLMCQPKLPRTGGRRSQCVVNRRNLQASSAKAALARRVGVEWLGSNARETLWEGMSVARLCQIVSGTSFREYLVQMGRDGEWVDTAFLHALGCAYGVNVLIFQPVVEPALVGISLLDGGGDSDVAPLMVPIALINDSHFWGVEDVSDDAGADPVDKGEHAVFRRSLGLCPGSTSPAGLASSRAGVGARTTPGHKIESKDEDEDAEEPGKVFHDMSGPDQGVAAALDVEIRLCQALTRWSPFATPSAEVLEAMGDVQRHRAAGSAVFSDMPSMCSQRAEAMTALAYEDGHALPEALRYQRLARIRLSNPTSWHRTAKDKSVTTRFLAVSAGVSSSANLSSMLERSTCSRHERPHAPGNPQCCGLEVFTGTMVYNWRVLWWSMPWVTRKELLLSFCRQSLLAHRATKLPDDRWRIQWILLGENVCRDAFLILTGVGVSVLQAARAGALQDRMSWSSPMERGLHSGSMTHAKPAAYLGARQWLEGYATTHAEWSPMEAKAYLPSGRKIFYYHHYRMDILRRHGLSEDDVAKAKAGGGKRKRGHDSLDGNDASAYALASRRMGDVPLADVGCFLRAWRIECPWLVVCKSVSMFTRCSVCEYLRLLIDQTPHDQEPLRQSLRHRLGNHFEFQAAQRLAHQRIEEECEQSEGQKWFMLIDKMDQKKTVCPTIWSQLATKLFQNQEKRLITGLIGTMWFGTRYTTHHVRTVFDDCSHGSEMQCSAILQNLHEVAMREGHLPKAFTIGADNTRKETKNQICMWFLVWLLCALSDTPLWMIDVVFLLVGHTHNKLDRMFSRIAVALRGQDYYTVVGMLRKVRDMLMYCRLHDGHLAQVWRWKTLLADPLPGSSRGMHNLDPAHAFRFTRNDGIYMQWKQWCTDESWSTPVQIVAPHEVQQLRSWRPTQEPMEFPSGGQAILDWLGRLEAWCASQPAGTSYDGLDTEFQWLRAAVRHQLPGAYAPGDEVEDFVRDLCGLPHTPPGAYVPDAQTRDFPQDIIAQLFPSADVPRIPSDSLVRVDNVTHASGGAVARSNIIGPGSLLVIAAPEGTVAHDRPLAILVGMAVETSCKRGSIVVVWYVPDLGRMENFRGGAKKMVLDVFGPWRPIDDLSVEALKRCRLPNPIVLVQSVLECNFAFAPEDALPYDVFDSLRTRHGIDLTGFSTSMTRRGNLYRSYALMRGSG